MLPVFLPAWFSFSKWDGKKADYLHNFFFFSLVGVQICASKIYNTSPEWVESGVTFVMCGTVSACVSGPYGHRTAHGLEGERCSETALWHAASILMQDNSLRQL